MEKKNFVIIFLIFIIVYQSFEIKRIETSEGLCRKELFESQLTNWALLSIFTVCFASFLIFLKFKLRTKSKQNNEKLQDISHSLIPEASKCSCNSVNLKEIEHKLFSKML
ncbi:hypothetical protein PVAND_000456 [Polypedilum vanderplanki]|uniref:Uncharacterized protein n=1 Tax=Polypedilum vanderplanki TaxID=319348 RepID=A0A9J6BKN4_POLVA|nr:hypothetical protein PVAND_000456 [Polypedilum vanderplanki]